ncbi:MAG: hypothetical protein NVS2B9_08990 [Myxococcales bacterium]
MRGTFLRGVERPGPARGGGLVLRRHRLALLVPLGLAAAGLASMAAELRSGSPLVAALFFALSAAVLALGARTELDTWTFDGAHAVRRTFAPGSLRFREVRLRASDIRRVGYVDRGLRSRAWLETRGGDDYALVEGDLSRVKEIAEAWASAARVSASISAGRVLH